MRTVVAYTSARILMLVVSFFVLYLCGVRSIIVLLAVSFLVSAVASYILLAKQREKMASALNSRIGRATSKAAGKAAELRDRLEEGAAAEDGTAADGITEDGTAEDRAAGPVSSAPSASHRG